FYGWYVGKLGSVHAHILPYCEGGKFYFAHKEGDTLQNAANLGAHASYYNSPLDPSAPDGVFPKTKVGTTSFICNVNAFWFTETSSAKEVKYGPWAIGLQRMPASYLNGTSNSVLFATACGNASATADGAGAGNVKGNHNWSNGYAHFPN